MALIVISFAIDDDDNLLTICKLPTRYFILSGRIGSLLPIPVMEKGKTYISLKIDKIGLKDATDFIDPYLTISVKVRIRTLRILGSHWVHGLNLYRPAHYVPRGRHLMRKKIMLALLT